jgi:hypothetical protein
MNSTSTRLPTPEGAGHRLAGQAPAQMLDAPTAFLTPYCEAYRENGGGL